MGFLIVSHVPPGLLPVTIVSKHIKDHIWFCKTAELIISYGQMEGQNSGIPAFRVSASFMWGMQTLVVTVCWGCIVTVFLH